jgi:hypothetical protein
MKKDLRAVPLHKDNHGLDLKILSGWVLPQAMSIINESFTLVKNESGLYSVTETIRKFAADNSSEDVLWMQALLKHLNTTPRGNILNGVQSSPTNIRYCGLVPLVLSAFKEYRSVGYSQWDWTDHRMYTFVDAELLDAVTYESVEADLDLEGLQLEACTVKKTGEVKSAKSISRVYKTSSAILNSLPRLSKLMLLQVWVATPELRNKYMILDPLNLDSMPEPINAVEIIPEPKKPVEDSWL